MERLTKIDGIGKNECIKCFGCDPEKAGAELEHCGYCEHWQQILDRLAAYEDTGLTPEEIVGLCEMDKRAKMAETLREPEEAAPKPTCAACANFLGGGDWNLCCKVKYDLCYQYSPACDNFEPKEANNAD